MCEEDEKIIHRLKYYNDEIHLAKRIVELQHCIENLRNQSKQKDNIIKEVREYIESNPLVYIGDTDVKVEDILYQEENIEDTKFFKTLLEILDRGK